MAADKPRETKKAGISAGPVKSIAYGADDSYSGGSI
jgi:hypothetical protein